MIAVAVECEGVLVSFPVLLAALLAVAVVGALVGWFLARAADRERRARRWSSGMVDRTAEFTPHRWAPVKGRTENDNETNRKGERGEP